MTPTAAWYDVPIAGLPFPVRQQRRERVLPDGYGADRGYQQRDGGQFDTPDEVFAWCGAAVLLSPAYLQSVGLLRRALLPLLRGHRPLLAGTLAGVAVRLRARVGRPPRALGLVDRGVPLFAHYVERNRLLMLTRNAPLSLAWREAGRHLLITGSYARRDILSSLPRPADRRSRPSAAGCSRWAPTSASPRGPRPTAAASAASAPSTTTNSWRSGSTKP